MAITIILNSNIRVNVSFVFLIRIHYALKHLILHYVASHNCSWCSLYGS